MTWECFLLIIYRSFRPYQTNIPVHTLECIWYSAMLRSLKEDILKQQRTYDGAGIDVVRSRHVGRTVQHNTRMIIWKSLNTSSQDVQQMSISAFWQKLNTNISPTKEWQCFFHLSLYIVMQQHCYWIKNYFNFLYFLLQNYKYVV